MKMKTAPMGWNSWDCYGAAVTEDIVRRNAEFMAEHLKEYGWEYIVVDIQWYEPYAATNEYHPFADVERKTASRSKSFSFRSKRCGLWTIGRICPFSWIEVRHSYYERDSTTGCTSEHKNHEQ